MHAVIDARADQQSMERLDAPDIRSPPQRWLTIINPSAGHHTNGWLRKMVRRIQRELGSDVAITRNYEQIAEVLRESAHADGIAVCGGDGTIAEAVNHIFWCCLEEPATGWPVILGLHPSITHWLPAVQTGDKPSICSRLRSIRHMNASFV